jgi:ATP/maltotriose-dependent transcriptional regulator MalT/DNA-binding SARP family transcriptional activator
LILLTAPSGYGKTVLLSQWLPAVQERWSPAWLTLDEMAQDPLHLVLGLHYALRDWLGADAVELIEESLADPQTDVRVSLTLLLNGLGALSQPLVLALDDVHTVATSGEALEMLEHLLGRAPPNLHVALASREELSLPSVPRLHAQGQVLRITVADLRFTTDEVKRLFAEVFDHSLSERQAAYLAQRTEGWPVALSLVYQMSRRGGANRIDSLVRQFSGAAPQLYDYLDAVVSERQPPDFQHFLMATSILDRLEPVLCDALVGGESAAVILPRLERQGLFTALVDPERGVYRYHTLFREFLQRRLRETKGTATVRRLHRRAAALLLERGDDEGAVQHLLSAQEYVTAADLFSSLQDRLFSTSRHHLMERWLEQFPPSLVQAHPWLLLVRARMAAVREEADRAQALYRQAEPLFLAEGDQGGLCEVYRGMGNLARTQGMFNRAADLYRKALDHASDETRRAELLGLMARSLSLQGERLQEALGLLDQAVEMGRRSNDLPTRAALYSIQGRMLSGVGDFVGAMEAFHAALDLWETCGNRHRQINPANNVAYHYCLLGQAEQAEPLARRAMELAEAFDRRLSYSYSLNILGELHRQRGDYSAARRFHLQALSIQRRLNERYEIPATLNWLGLLARREGDLDEALRRGEEGLSLREQMGVDYEIGLSLIGVGATHLALGHLSRAAQMWRRALDIFVAAGARYEQTEIHFYLAVLAHRRGNDAAFEEHLGQSFALARSFEYGSPPRCLHFFVEEAAWTAPILAHALGRGLATQCADCLMPRLGRPALDALLPLLDDARPELRAHAARLLGRLRDAVVLKSLCTRRRDPDPMVRQAVQEAVATILESPPPLLRVRCLGQFRLWRGQSEITRWGRAAARGVFQYLLAHRPRPVPMDRLMETFWPDSGPDRARKNLHQAVAALRRALEPELATGMPSRYLEVGANTYRLILPAGSWVDYEEFEDRLRPLLARCEDTPPETETLTEILGLYRGDYLVEALYEDWTAPLRERMRDLYLDGLRLLARLQMQAGRSAAAAHTVSCALELDPWDEEATLLLMRAHQAQGNLPAALRAYETLRSRLKRDLGLSPRPDLTAFYQSAQRKRR